MDGSGEAMNKIIAQTSGWGSITPILDRLTPLPEPAKPRSVAKVIASLLKLAGSFLSILPLFGIPIILTTVPPNFILRLEPWLDKNIQSLFQGDWPGPRLIITGFFIVAVWLQRSPFTRADTCASG